MGEKSEKMNLSKMEEGVQKIDGQWLEWVIQRNYKRNYRVADSENKFHEVWRSSMADVCTGLPFSKLVATFHKIYGGQIMSNSPPQLQLQNQENIDDFPDNEDFPDLDFHVIEEILRRLPVPSLLRAKIVCKDWNKAISATTLNLVNGKDNHVFVMQHMVVGFERIALFSRALNRWFQIPLLPQERRRGWKSEQLDGQLYLCAAAAGVYLFLDWDHTHRKPLIIINPITLQRRELPPLPDHYEWMEGTAVELIVHSDHFDIIALGIAIRTSASCALLYNSTTNEWTTVPARLAVLQDVLLTFGYWIRHPWRSVLHNGVIYFTQDYGGQLGCYDIASKEFKFREIEGRLPSDIDYHDRGNNPHSSLPSLVVCNGKLLLVGRLEKGVGGPIWGRFPFIEHSVVGIWELYNNITWCWFLISETPQDLLEDTVKSSHGTDFLVAASSDIIWLTIRGSRNLLTLDLRSMEWSVLPGCPAEDTVDTFPRSAVCGTLSIDNFSLFH